MPVDAVYLDFQKAFDKMSREKLVLKMRLEMILQPHPLIFNTRGWDCEMDRKLFVWIEGRGMLSSGWERVESGSHPTGVSFGAGANHYFHH